MKAVFAIVLVLVALASTEPPRFRGSSQRGWQAQQAPPKPAPSYGPPPQEPTTESQVDETTDLPQFAKIRSKQSNSKQSYFVVLPQNSVVVSQPQSQNLVYATVTDVQKNSPLVAALPRATFVASAAPLNSPPRLQLQSLPLATYKTLYSPLAASYLETPTAGFLVSA